MDDASSDSTPEICASYGDRIRYVRQASTRGQFGNVNDGVALATGDLIGVFHADDVYLPHMLEREIEWLERFPDAGAVFCSDVFVDAHGKELGRLELPPEIRGGRPLDYPSVLNALLMYKNRFLRCPTALVRASVYRELGLYREQEFKNTSDLEMWLRIVRRYPIGVLDDHLQLYRRRPGSSSHSYQRARTDPERFFTIMDLELRSGAFSVATAEAVRSYEAHRAHDATMRAVSHYVLGDVSGARAALRGVGIRALLRGRQIQSVRLSMLSVGLRLLVRLPRVPAIARAFERRWYGRAPSGAISP